jgi:hypothetical protein
MNLKRTQEIGNIILKQLSVRKPLHTHGMECYKEWGMPEKNEMGFELDDLE